MTSEEIEISISIPMLEPGSVIGAYELFTIPIQALNTTENIIVGTSDITIEILPVFALNVIEAPGRIAVLPQEKRTVEYQLENVGFRPKFLPRSWLRFWLGLLLSLLLLLLSPSGPNFCPGRG